MSASVVDQGASYVMTLVHPTYGTIGVTFQKGSQSAGGTITIGGSTTPLTNAVQSLTVGDGGVAWGGSAPAPTQPPAAPTQLRIVP